MFGGTKRFTSDEIAIHVERLAGELVNELKSAGSLFHHHVELFNLNRAMLYAVPNHLEGYKKAMKVMMRRPKLQRSESDPDDNCEHIWAAERRYINLPLTQVSSKSTRAAHYLSTSFS